MGGGASRGQRVGKTSKDIVTTLSSKVTFFVRKDLRCEEKKVLTH